MNDVQIDVQIVFSDDLTWRSIIEEIDHTVYQTPSYARVTECAENAIAKCLIARMGDFWMVLPIMVSPIDSLFWDARSPYGYPGLLFAGSPDSEMRLLLFEHGLRYLADSGCISLFIRTNPEIPHAEMRKSGFLEFEKESELVVCRLELADEEFSKALSPPTRRRLNNLRNTKGYKTFTTSEPDYFELFSELYLQRMKELSASPSYFFSRKYFRSLSTELGNNAKLRYVIQDNEIVAGAIFLEHRNYSTYHLSASTLEARKEGLPSLLIDDERRELRRRGFNSLLLGGGVGGSRDPLMNFKRNFSKTTLEFRVLGFILNPEIYVSLCQHSGAQARGDFFPGYRV